MLNTLISLGYLLINSHLRHIATTHNNCSISVILIFICQTSICQKEPTRWRTSLNNISSSCLKNTSKTLMRKWQNYQKTSKKRFAVLSDQIKKSNQINTMSPSPTQNDTSTPPDPTTAVPAHRRDPPLEGGHSTKIGGMWTLKHEISSPKFYELLIKKELKGDTAQDLKTSITTSRCASMRWLKSKKTSFLITSPSKETLSLKNTSSQIAITLHIPEMSRYTLTLDTHY